MHTYIYTLFCKLKLKSSVMCICITCLLICFITYSYLNDHLLDMVSILNTHHNRTSITTNEINIYNFGTSCVCIDLFMHILHCNVFMQLHVNFSLFGAKNLFLSMYRKLSFKNIIFNIWKSSVCCWVVKWMICQNVCGQSTLNYSSLFIVHDASILTRHNESFALFLCLSVGHPISLSFVIRNQITLHFFQLISLI